MRRNVALLSAAYDATGAPMQRRARCGNASVLARTERAAADSLAQRGAPGPFGARARRCVVTDFANVDRDAPRSGWVDCWHSVTQSCIFTLRYRVAKSPHM